MTTRALQTERDFRQVVVDYATEAASCGAVYLEGIFTPALASLSHPRRCQELSACGQSRPEIPQQQWPRDWLREAAISAGNADSLALTSAGQVLAWGANADGQLGNGTVADSDVPVKVTLPPGVKVTAVAAGDSHNVARTSKGKVLAWGLGSDGELGNGATASNDTPVRARLPKGTKVTGLFAGCAHTLALTTTGKVLAWGSDSAGQLGNGRIGGHRDTPVQTRLSKGTTVTAISAGCDHSLARTAKGHVLAWGLGHNGELGNGGTASSDVPVRVKLPAGLAAIALGSGPDADFSFAITR